MTELLLFELRHEKCDPQVYADPSWLPISKMVWHFTIGKAVCMLKLSKVGCKDLVIFGGEEEDTSVLVQW